MTARKPGVSLCNPPQPAPRPVFIQPDRVLPSFTAATNQVYRGPLHSIAEAYNAHETNICKIRDGGRHGRRYGARADPAHSGPAPRGQDMAQQAMRKRMFQALNLTDAQKQQAKTFMQQAKQNAQPLRTQLRANRAGARRRREGQRRGADPQPRRAAGQPAGPVARHPLGSPGEGLRDPDAGAKGEGRRDARKGPRPHEQRFEKRKANNG